MIGPRRTRAVVVLALAVLLLAAGGLPGGFGGGSAESCCCDGGVCLCAYLGSDGGSGSDGHTAHGGLHEASAEGTSQPVFRRVIEAAHQGCPGAFCGSSFLRVHSCESGPSISPARALVTHLRPRGPFLRLPTSLRNSLVPRAPPARPS
jgi:hypothetical protein